MKKLSDPLNRVKMLKEKMIRDDELAFGNKEYLLSFFNVEEFIIQCLFDLVDLL